MLGGQTRWMIRALQHFREDENAPALKLLSETQASVKNPTVLTGVEGDLQNQLCCAPD